MYLKNYFYNKLLIINIILVIIDTTCYKNRPINLLIGRLIGNGTNSDATCKKRVKNRLNRYLIGQNIKIC